MSIFFFIFLSLGLGFPAFHTCNSVNGHEFFSHRTTLLESPCPLNFDVLRKLTHGSPQPEFLDLMSECRFILQGLRIVQSEYLRSTGFFLPPLNASESCWDLYEAVINRTGPNLNVRSICGFETSWISQGCMNITSKSQFERLVPESSLQEVRRTCNQSLQNSSSCSSCITSLSSLLSSYLPGPEIGNVTVCDALPAIYAAGLVNQFGPLDEATYRCLFSLEFSWSYLYRRKNHKGLIGGFVVGSSVGLLGVILGFWFLRRKMKKFFKIEKNSVLGFQLFSENSTLVRFKFEEIKQATNNFSRENIIGMGSYGNVYKGILPDGSEVAVKRFKNCSAAGDSSFTHEVEVIASVRHVNLVSLRGYCSAATPLEGHQRMIVCDLIPNGSLFDHLFGSLEKKLSWPIRRDIAIGMARGLAYLHYGAQPAIIHRDIKASNVLLDEKFEPKLADFGLAKFVPEGISHLSTSVAGTMGYVALEYALYGQLTERSDVYSFGVVLLELLSGRKALIAGNEIEIETSLVTDWAWSLVREGRALDVIENGMPEMGLPEVMEKYVLVAVLASHPELYVRPTMDQIVKILETDMPVPSIPERPISIVAEIVDIQRSTSSSGLSYLSASPGYQPCTFDNDHPTSEHSEKRENSSRRS